MLKDNIKGRDVTYIIMWVSCMSPDMLEMLVRSYDCGIRPLKPQAEVDLACTIREGPSLRLQARINAFCFKKSHTL